MTLSIDPTPTALIPRGSPIPLLRSSTVAHADREVHVGNLVRVRRGILASSALWSALAPWQRYEARVHAVAMTHPGAVFCLESAASILGLPIIGEPRDVHVLDTPTATSRLSGGIRLHTTAQDRTIVEVGGMRVTSVLDTMLDVARSRHPSIGLAVADAGLRVAPSLSVEVLVAHNESRISSRGRRRARWALHRANPLAETALESLSRAAIEWLGFEEPELQREFRSSTAVDRSDMWWPSARVIGEADGEVKYDGSLQDPVQAVRKERVRDVRLRRFASAILHWGWTDVARIAPLRSTLRAAGVPQVALESSLELHGLSALLCAPRTLGAETAVGHRD